MERGGRERGERGGEGGGREGRERGERGEGGGEGERREGEGRGRERREGISSIINPTNCVCMHSGDKRGGVEVCSWLFIL